MEYQSANIGPLGAGIDQLSPENRIPEGFSEYLRNVEPTPEDSLKKRKGYALYSGGVPLRVEKIDYSGDDICFYFDDSVDVSSIDLSSVRGSPILVYGRTANSHADGDFTDTDSLHWYDTFSSDPKQTLAVGSGSYTIPGATHGQGNLVSVGLSLSTDMLDNSNSLFIPDSVTINKATSDVTVTYTNGTDSALKAFTYVKSRAAVAGASYVSGVNTVAVGTNSFSISAATHGLNNFNILTEIYRDTGTDYVRIVPDAIEISATGTVTVTLTNGTGASIDVVAILYVVSAAQSASGSAPASSTITVSLPSLTSNFLYVTCYLEDIGTGTLSQVIPDSIDVSDASDSATVTFVNSGSSANFSVFWDEGFVTSNKLCVVGSTVTTPYSDEAVQMTIWGLPHRSIYASYLDLPRAGWVNHLDNYRSEGEERLVAGLGGNLFASYSRAEVGTTYGLPLYYPTLSARVSTDTTIGPLFSELGGGASRSRGTVSFVGGGGGWARVTSVAYVSGTSVAYTLSCPSLSVVGSLATVIGTTDVATFTGCGYSIHNGSFSVVSLALGVNPDTLVLTVSNPEIDGADWDISGLQGKAGVFTDKLPLTSTGVTETNVFLPGDAVLSSLWDDETEYTVVANSEAAATFISGVTEEVSVPSGLRVTASRTGKLLPLRTLAGTKTVENLVRGDTVYYSAYTRPLRVTFVRTAANEAVSLVGDGTEASITLSSSTTAELSVGQTIALLKAGVYSGEHTITGITSTTVFTIASSETASVSGVLLGKCIEIDENLLWQDTDTSTTSVEVQRRWIPIEAPTDYVSDVTPSYYYRHFTSSDFSNQPFLRSVISKDSLYLTNGLDAVQKFDGSNIYRAGLPRFQLLSYLTVDSAAAATIEVNLPTIATADVVSVTDNVFKVTLGEEQKFVAGSTLRHSFTGGYTDYLVNRVFTSATDGFIEVQAYGAITLGVNPTLARLAVYRYYARLNAIDANGSVVASAVCGSEDYRVNLSESAAILHRLVVPSAWDTYDFSRIEAQIYRTKLGEVAPFYRLTSLSVPFGSRFVDFADSRSDDTLTDLDLVNTSLLGAEIGTTFSHPLKAKWATSLGNRLVLGNLETWPYITAEFVDTGTTLNAAALAGKRFLLRRDSGDTLTTSDVENRLGFEFLNSGANTINPAADIAVNVNGTVTITDANSLSANDWVYLFHSAVQDGNLLTFAGHFRVVSATGAAFTVDTETDPSYTPVAADVDRWIAASDERDLPIWLGTDGNFATINGNVDSALGVQSVATRRLAIAVNSAMARSTSPWVIANAGGEYKYGEIVFDFAKILGSTPELVLPSFSGFNLFVNDILRESSDTVQAVSSLFPSRIIVSLPSYPEMFDAPAAALDSDSLSAIDVDRDNGQETTMGIPFFGDSAFGGSQKDGFLLVFKTNSIYLVNVNQKAQGLPAVQKIDSQGKGCPSPMSVSTCRNSVMFVDNSGIYRVGQDLKVDYIGRKMQRSWRSEVSRADMELFFGHYSSEDNKYKLSLPFTEDALDYTDRAFVYDTTREYTPDGYRDGSWTTYSNVPSIGWVNSSNAEYFASPFGEVFSVRASGEVSDYRDDGAAIDAEATLRAVDFGDSSIRKAVLYLIAQFRTEVSSLSTEVSVAADLTTQFLPCDTLSLKKQITIADGFSDEGERKVETVRFAMPTRKAVYYQVKIANGAIDEDMELTTVAFRVGGLNSRSTREAADTIES